MSKKRFIIDEEGISDTSNDNWYCWKEEIVNLLNSLHEKNEQLKKERDYWKAKYEEGTETFELKRSEERFKIIGLCDEGTSFIDKETEMVYKTISSRTVELINLLNEAKKSWNEVAEELYEENKKLKNQLEQIPPKVREIWLK